MITSKIIGFSFEEELFEKTVDILKEEYGLVYAKNDLVEGNSIILVWEDDLGIGRYRVHCNKGWSGHIFGEKKKVDMFYFHYWTNSSRFDREIFSKDPMAESMRRIEEISENVKTTKHKSSEKSIQELERIIFGNKK